MNESIRKYSKVFERKYLNESIWMYKKIYIQTIYTLDFLLFTSFGSLGSLGSLGSFGSLGSLGDLGALGGFDASFFVLNSNTIDESSSSVLSGKYIFNTSKAVLYWKCREERLTGYAIL